MCRKASGLTALEGTGLRPDCPRRAPLTPTSLPMRCPGLLLPPGHLPSLPAGSSASTLRIFYQGLAFGFCFWSLRPFLWCPPAGGRWNCVGRQAVGTVLFTGSPRTAPLPRVLSRGPLVAGTGTRGGASDSHPRAGLRGTAPGGVTRRCTRRSRGRSCAVS